MASENIKSDFPIFKNNPGIAYLDNAATTQRPSQVISAIKEYYETSNANIHRGIYKLSERSSDLYDKARQTTADFINAKKNEILFTKNASESLNLVAYSLLAPKVQECCAPANEKDEEILLCIAEHHSNIVPWQQLAKITNKKLVFFNINKETFEIDMEDFRSKLSDKTKIVAFSHVSNVLGYINPVKEMTKLAHEKGAIVIVDGAQAIPHLDVDVKDIDCDFYAFSGHKMMAPFGIGVLYCKEEFIDQFPPFMYGGGMVRHVTKDDSEFADAPDKYEAGTQNIAGAVGLMAAIEYIKELRTQSNILEHEQEIFHYLLDQLKAIGEVEIYSSSDIKNKIPLVCFNIKDVHGHDVAQVLDDNDVAIRAGTHCTYPLHDFLGIAASARASLYYYNTKEDVDQLIKAVKETVALFR